MKKKLLLFLFLTFSLVLSIQAQDVTLTGQVKDKTSGETLPGATIKVVGADKGTNTDINGKYSILLPAGLQVIEASFVGYEPMKQTITLVSGQSNTLDFSLTSATKQLDELVVVGYGVQQKSVVTGAISTVKAADLQDMPIQRVEQALQGRTSGVTIASASGQPGAASTVRIRGTTSINVSDPLYVIDGVPVDIGGIDYLNMNDVASIEVLKDAASAAIYGTRAANGVILITTRSGKGGGAQGMSVNFNSYIGIQSPAKKLDLCNAEQYAMLRNEEQENAGLPVVFENPDTLGEGTDWQNEIFSKNSIMQNYELSVTGANEKSSYYSSMGYYMQDGIVCPSISNYRRIALRLNSTHNVNKWLRFGENLGYAYIKSSGSLNSNSEYGGPLASAINLDPTTPVIITDSSIANSPPYSTNPVVLDPNGNPYAISKYVVQEMTNPVAYTATRAGNYGWSSNAVGDVYAEVEPIKGLVLRSDFGFKLSYWGDVSFTPVYYLNANNSVVQNNFFKSQNQGFTYNWENTAAYARVIQKHDFKVLLGMSAYQESSQGVSARYYDLPVNTFDEASMNYAIPDANKLAGGWEAPDHRISSIFARVNYNYDQKYLFTGIIRRDGSSRFGPNNKYGYFPSFSVGWVASKEGFWPENKVVDFVKVRGSYGVNGNDNIQNFLYLSTVSGGRNYVYYYDNYIIGYSPDAPSNPDLKWEQTSQWDIGVDMLMFTNFNFTFDYYMKNTNGMLDQFILPMYVGAISDPIANVASMTNKGVEFELGYQKQFGEVNFGGKGNFSYLKNEITDLGSVQYRTGATFQSSSYEISRLEVGHPIGAFYGFEVLGIFQSDGDIQNYVNENGDLIQPNAQPGDFKYADLNGDGTINADDRTFIGDPTPTISYGFTLTADWKGIDLVFFGQGVAGNDIYNGNRRLDIPTANWTTDALGRWHGVGTSNDYPRLVTGDPNKNFSNPSSFQLSPGAYFRIKTIEIGYTLPKQVAGKMGLKNLRVYVGAKNLVTWTQYSGFDPEIGGSSYGIDRGFYPQARTFLFGLNVTI